MDKFGDIQKKLERLVTNEKRLEQFNETFHRVLLDNAKNSDYEIINGDGVVQIENLKRITDRIGTGSIDFYRKEKDLLTNEITGRCARIPSKDLLFLISVCLELDTDTVSTLLISAGYSNYVKNLKEFIIFCGLNNIRSVEDVSAKLFQHGYREQDALMSVTYKDETSAMESFSAYFDNLFALKNLDKKDVLEEAGLISPTQDSEINRYYNSAFYGQKTVKIVLNADQLRSLFKALRLDYEEQTAAMDFLRKLGITGEDDVELLLADFKEDIGRTVTNAVLKYPDIEDNSVFTQYLSTQLRYLQWERLDEFVLENFGTIRSFAVFYDQLVRYEGYRNISQFCSAFNLSAKSHYNYIAGISIPALPTLTATSFLFRKMTMQIYNTLLKKAGKHIFDCDDDSSVYLLAKELLLRKEKDKIIFGDLFDCTERIIAVREDAGFDDDLGLLFTELVKVLSRFLLQYMRQNRIEIGTETANALRTAPAQTPDFKTGRFSDVLGRALSGCAPEKAAIFLKLLKDRFGFSDDSRIMNLWPASGTKGDIVHG